MHLKFRNVNDAFKGLVSGFHTGKILTNVVPSRYGEVMRVEEPVTVTYEYPRERVLFNAARDCNPFFHLFESLWMLAGRNDIAPLAYYSSQISKFSDDGVTQHDAYGYRWRHWFGWDQLKAIIEELRKNPTSRRCVLQMWDAGATEVSLDGEGPLAVNRLEQGVDFYKATHGGLAVPCNLCALFEVEDEQFLNMTVCNRSNDLILGMLGANVVHFSFLQEYLACCIGLQVGKYHQFTNNLHAYTENWDAEKWLSVVNEDTATMYDPVPYDYATSKEDKESNGGALPCMLLNDPNTVLVNELVDDEIRLFIDNPFKEWKCKFLNRVAKPMMQAFKHHKARHYGLAYEAMGRVQADDWNWAGMQWLQKRQVGWDRKNAIKANKEKEAASGALHSEDGN